tara:strand:+ start:110 stop:1027 length:918 start_codon:yes stop_codon:yes gene_type:complete
MELSIVICTYNRSSFLREGLEAIVQQRLAFLDVPIELIVLDNNSSDDTSSVVEEFQNEFSSISLVYYLEKQQGLSYSRNRAIQIAKGKFIAFLDDDAVVNANWLTSLLHGINHIDAQVFGGPIYPRFEIPCPAWIDSNYFIRKFKKNNGYLYGLSQIDGFAGGNVCFKKDVFDQIGCFDTSIGMIGNTLGLGEETDLFARLYDSSYRAKLYNLQEMSIIHFEAEWKLNSLYLKNRISLSGEQSARRFINRNIFLLGYFIVFFKLIKQLLFSFYYLIQIPFFKTTRFKFLKCIWIVRGLIKGVLNS